MRRRSRLVDVWALPSRLGWNAAWLATALMTAPWACCSRSSPPAERSGQALAAKHTSPPTSPIRLAELLDGAVVRSPLAAVESLAAVTELPDDVQKEIVFRQDFEIFSKAMVSWEPSAGCRATARPEGGPRDRALLYEGRRGHQCIFVLPAEPGAYYRIQRARKTTDAHIDFKLLETRVPLRHPKTLNHPGDVARILDGKFVGTAKLLYVHDFPLPQAEEGWHLDAIGILTSPFTNSLVLMVHDALAVTSQHKTQVFFDELAVVKLNPTRSQELALLKGASLAEGADPRLGIYKHGQFLPIGDAVGAKPPRDANFDFRYALLAVAPTDLVFSLTLAEAARLSFSTALHRGSKPGDAATFQVFVEARGGRHMLHEQIIEIGSAGENWHWHDATVALDAFAGEQIRLVFATRAPKTSRGLAVWGHPVIETTRKSEDKPNVLLIGVDTLRADRLALYGHNRATSENLSSLARDGATFTQAISVSNWTSPSFASLMTGLVPSRHQVVHRARAIAPALTTLAERFRAGGYRTHAVIYKAYLYDMGFEQGFDTFFNVPYPEVKADHNVSKALAWLGLHHDRRFFLFLHLNDPHQPFNQPPPFGDIFTDVAERKRLGVRLPVTVGTANNVRGCRRCRRGSALQPAFKQMARQLYDAEIAYLDNRLGRLFDALRRYRIYDDTIIALFSDHGEMMWEHGDYFGHGGPFMKEELLHVPLVIKPHRGSGLELGRRIANQVTSFDLGPTLLDLAGLDLGAFGGDARSLLPLLATAAEGSVQGAQADRVVVSENIKHHVLSVRSSGWKYVLRNPASGSPSESLYDLRTDPSEERSVAARHQEELVRLRKHACDFMLSKREGRYVVVTGPQAAMSYRVLIRGDGPLQSVHALLGLTPRKLGSDEAALFVGRQFGPVVFVARVKAPQGVTLEISVQAGRTSLETRITPDQVTPYEPGTLVEAGGKTIAEVRVFEGPPPPLLNERRVLAAQRLKTLRALGYME